MVDGVLDGFAGCILMACVQRTSLANRDRGLTCRPAGGPQCCSFAHRASDERGPFRLGDVKRGNVFRDSFPATHPETLPAARDGLKRCKCLAFPMCLGFFVDFRFARKYFGRAGVRS